MLVLLISVTLILLKLGFLLLLIVGPFFLLIGTHPGFGRVVALRWLELLIGVLLKQAAVALVLSVLLYCYALIMGTSDAVLPWALKILMIALVTVAAFIYRRPFQHLFSAVGYGVIGSRDRAEARSAPGLAATARGNTVDAATLAVPGFAAYRAGRWARRNPGAGGRPGAGGAAASARRCRGRGRGRRRGRRSAGPRQRSADGCRGWRRGATERRGPDAGLAAARPGRPAAAGVGRRTPPPLNLPARNGGQRRWPAAARAVPASVGAGARSEPRRRQSGRSAPQTARPARRLR